MPSLDPAENGIGFDPSILPNGDRLQERRNHGIFNLVITSDNKFEVVIMHKVLEAMLIATVDTMCSLDLENPKISSQDLRFASDSVPNGVFARGINLDLSFDNKVRVGNHIMINVNKLVVGSLIYDEKTEEFIEVNKSFNIE
jgi:hypothetical protein